MKHYFVAAGLAWGHVRPSMAMCIKLCRLNPEIHITWVVQRPLAKKSALDRRRYGFESVQDRFRIVEAGEAQREGLIESEEYRRTIFAIPDDALAVYKQIIGGEQFMDSLSGEMVAPWNVHPEVVILDCSMLSAHAAIFQMGATAAVKPRQCLFFPIATSFVAAYVLAACRAGWTDTAHIVVPRVNGGIILLVMLSGVKIGNRDIKSGEMWELPGMHPAYQYELDPNVSTLNLYDLWDAFFKLVPLYDNFITAWPIHLSEQSSAQLDNMLKGRNFCVGPQLPDDPTSTEHEAEDAQALKEIVSFLDRQQEHSVIYISFGSLEFPPTQEQLWQFFDQLDHLQIPYIMSRGMAPPGIRADLSTRIAQSQGRGLFVEWAPQVTILQHIATMGFMTHGGSNSAMEALICGVPMLQWPTAWDQPMIANQLDYEGAAIELLQVRGEHNIGRKTARGPTVIGSREAIAEEMLAALERLRGESGVAMRARVREIGDEVMRDAAEGGASWQHLHDLAFLSD